MKCILLIVQIFLSSILFAQNKNASKPGCGPILEKDKKKLMENKTKKGELNVLNQPLQIAGTDPITGFYRDGFCSTGMDDRGVHVVAAVVTKEFLEFSKAQGNDLMTAYPANGFAGLKPGDKWCLCAARWKEAYNAGVAPPVILEATHKKALEFATIEQLESVGGK